MNTQDQLSNLTNRLVTELHKEMEIADQLIVLIQAYQDNLLKMMKEMHNG